MSASRPVSDAVAGGVAARAGSGMVWVGLATGAARVAGLVATVALARLLSPEAFGLVGFALAIIVFIEALGDLGTGAALVYWPGRTAEAARVTFAFNLVLGLGWGVIGWLVSPAISRFFDAAEAAPVVAAMMLVVPLRFLGNTPDALLRRDLRFRERVLPEVAGALAKLVVGVGAAVGGAGVWALVAGQLTGQSLTTLMLWRAVDWRPRGPVPADLAKAMLRYGGGLVLIDLLAAVTHHIDLVIVGKVLGTRTLGLYQVAVRLPEVTVLMMVWVVAKVLFPAFARLHEAGAAIAPLYLRALRYVASAAIPAGVGLALIAPGLVAVVFGEGWAGAAPILRGLAVYATVRALGSHAGDVLKGTGRTGLLAALGVGKAAVLVPALLVAAPRGASALAWTLATVAAAGAALNVGVAGRLVGFGPRAVAAAIAPAAVATVPMAASVLLLAPYLWSIHSATGLVSTVALAVVVYGAVLAWMAPDLARGLVAAARRHSGGAASDARGRDGDARPEALS